MTQDKAPDPKPSETVPPVRLPEPGAPPPASPPLPPQAPSPVPPQAPPSPSQVPPPPPPSQLSPPPPHSQLPPPSEAHSGEAAVWPDPQPSATARPKDQTTTTQPLVEDGRGPLASAEDGLAPPAGWEDIFEAGEELLWQGQPIPGADWSDLFSPRGRAGLIPLVIGTVWIILALAIVQPFWAKFVMAAFGLPLLRSAHASLGRPFDHARAAQTTWYTLSSRALYIATTVGGRRQLERFPLDRLEMEPRLIDGSPGNIWFAEAGSALMREASSGSFSQRHRGFRKKGELIGFRRIENAREVFGLLTRARAKLGVKRVTRTLEEL